MADQARLHERVHWRGSVEVRPVGSNRKWTRVMRVGWSEYPQYDHDHLRAGLARFCQRIKGSGAGEERLRFGEESTRGAEGALYQGPVQPYFFALREDFEKGNSCAILEAKSILTEANADEDPFKEVDAETVVKGRGQVVLCESRLRSEGITLSLEDLQTVRDFTRRHTSDEHFSETRMDDRLSDPSDAESDSSIILSHLLEVAAGCLHAVPGLGPHRALVARWRGNGPRSSVESADLQDWWQSWQQAKASALDANGALLAGTFRSFRLEPSLAHRIVEFVGMETAAEVRISICDDMGLAEKFRRFMRGELRALDEWTLHIDYYIEARLRVMALKGSRWPSNHDLNWLEFKWLESSSELWRREELWRNQKMLDSFVRPWLEGSLTPMSMMHLKGLKPEVEKDRCILNDRLLTRLECLAACRRSLCIRASIAQSLAEGSFKENEEEFKKQSDKLRNLNEEILAWLEEKGVPLAEGLPNGRFPEEMFVGWTKAEQRAEAAEEQKAAEEREKTAEEQRKAAEERQKAAAERRFEERLGDLTEDLDERILEIEADYAGYEKMMAKRKAAALQRYEAKLEKLNEERAEEMARLQALPRAAHGW